MEEKQKELYVFRFINTPQLAGQTHEKAHRLMLEPGGLGKPAIWAPFNEMDLYSTTNKAYARRIRSLPNFNRDYVEVTEPKVRRKVKDLPPEKYRCQVCQVYTADKEQSMQLHARIKHQQTVSQEDIKAKWLNSLWEERERNKAAI